MFLMVVAMAALDARASAAHRFVLRGQGQDGANGRASVTVVADLSADGPKTRVDLETGLKLTGKPAQFGRSVLADVGDRLIGQFADALAQQLAADKLAPPKWRRGCVRAYRIGLCPNRTRGSALGCKPRGGAPFCDGGDTAGRRTATPCHRFSAGLAITFST